MVANKNTLRGSTWLILLSVFLWVSVLQAQPQPEATDSPDLTTTDPVEPSGSIENRRIERLGEVSTDQWEMDLALPKAAPGAAAANNELALPDEEQNQVLQGLLSKLADNPRSTRVLGQLDTLLTDVLEQSTGLMDAGSFEQADKLLSLIQSINPGLSGFSDANDRMQAYDAANELLLAGHAALDSQRLLTPENDSALYYFKRVLSNNPTNQSAQSGVTMVQAALVELALESARELDFETSETWLLEASAVQDDQHLVDNARGEVAAFKRDRATELEQKATTAMASGNFDLADLSIIELIALGEQEVRVDSLRARLEEARLYGGFEPGHVISDVLLQSGGKGPPIVIVTAGSFLMGSKGRSESAYDNEKPRHRVTIAQGFGLGIKEVSVDEFRLFIERSGYRTAAERSGSSNVYDEAAGRLSSRAGVDWRHDYKGKIADTDMPVLHVSLHDAQAYVDWLARETGKNYRLPSEAEYEYVARAGGSSTYWWGERSPKETVENLTGERDKSPGKREWTSFFNNYGDGHWGPAPTGSISHEALVHPMGVFDIAGNVSEWTEDCWHQNYIKAPVDGSAWVNPGCTRRVVRGGYWASAPEQSRAAFRISAKAETHGPMVGIRIARDL